MGIEISQFDVLKNFTWHEQAHGYFMKVKDDEIGRYD